MVETENLFERIGEQTAMVKVVPTQSQSRGFEFCWHQSAFEKLRWPSCTL